MSGPKGIIDFIQQRVYPFRVANEARMAADKTRMIDFSHQRINTGRREESRLTFHISWVLIYHSILTFSRSCGTYLWCMEGYGLTKSKDLILLICSYLEAVFLDPWAHSFVYESNCSIIHTVFPRSIFPYRNLERTRFIWSHRYSAKLDTINTEWKD